MSASTPSTKEATPSTPLTTTHHPHTTHHHTNLQQLYSGAQGKCFVATTQTTGQQVVLKIPNKGQQASFNVEKSALNQLDHPRIVKCLGQDLHYNNALVLEYAQHGDLMSFLMEKTATGKDRIPEKICRQLAKQLFQALDHCNAKQIKHRDIKPENIFLDANYCIKVGK